MTTPKACSMKGKLPATRYPATRHQPAVRAPRMKTLWSNHGPVTGSPARSSKPAEIRKQAAAV